MGISREVGPYSDIGTHGQDSRRDFVSGSEYEGTHARRGDRGSYLDRVSSVFNFLHLDPSLVSGPEVVRRRLRSSTGNLSGPPRPLLPFFLLPKYVR